MKDVKKEKHENKTGEKTEREKEAKNLRKGRGKEER
jgi:hypothetical protein